MRWMLLVLFLGLAPGARAGVDVNSCTYSELLSLPGVGPRLASAILEDHSQRGDFRSAADLDRVKGIGPALLARIAPMVEFRLASGAPTPSSSSTTPAESTTSPPPVDVNSATVEQLDELPGIGKVLASRIAQTRAKNGPFRSTDDLVPILGPKRARALAPRIGFK